MSESIRPRRNDQPQRAEQQAHLRLAITTKLAPYSSKDHLTKVVSMPASFTKVEFGMVNGEKVFKYVITNSNGLSISCTNYGATIMSVMAPDRHGKLEEVSLCYSTLEELQKTEGRPYFGCVAGRVANRISKGTFHIDDRTYNLVVNNGENHLHGGTSGFDQKVWSAVELNRDDRIGVEFQYVSPDGEENYPGNLIVRSHEYKLNPNRLYT